MIGLERAFAENIADHRFLPYLQFHEFEAFIFVDPSKLGLEFIGREKPIANLTKLRNQFQSPEDIDDGAETAPSKRIIAELPDYAGRKVQAGPMIAQAIGLETLREHCRHFQSWLLQLEQLSG